MYRYNNLENAIHPFNIYIAHRVTGSQRSVVNLYLHISEPGRGEPKLGPFSSRFIARQLAEKGRVSPLTAVVKGDTELLCVRVAGHKLEQRIIFTAVFEVSE